jgi:hypothetical protein
MVAGIITFGTLNWDMPTEYEDSDQASDDPSDFDTPYIVETTDRALDDDTPADIDEEKARLIVEQLLEKNVISLPSDRPILIHEPSGLRFESNVNLAHFHWGWIANSQSN